MPPLLTDSDTGPALIICAFVLTVKIFAGGQINFQAIGEKITESSVDLMSIALSFCVIAGLNNRFATGAVAIVTLLITVTATLMVYGIVVQIRRTPVNNLYRGLQWLGLVVSFGIPLYAISRFGSVLLD